LLCCCCPSCPSLKGFCSCKRSPGKKLSYYPSERTKHYLDFEEKEAGEAVPRSLKVSGVPCVRDRTEFFFTELDTDEILWLEGSVGPFTKKAARGSSTPTRIIGPKKPDDPEYVPECKMKITFQPNKLQLAVQFNYIIRDELGRAY